MVRNTWCLEVGVCRLKSRRLGVRKVGDSETCPSRETGLVWFRGITSKNLVTHGGKVKTLLYLLHTSRVMNEKLRVKMVYMTT